MFKSPFSLTLQGVSRTTELDMTSPGHDLSWRANITCYTLHHDEHGGVDASMTMGSKDGRVQEIWLCTFRSSRRISARTSSDEDQVRRSMK